MSDLLIYEEMVRLMRAGEAFVLATVIGHNGSSPRKSGARMLLKSDGGILGSVGGGRVEGETIQAARLAMAEGTPRTLSFVLTAEYGYACGGSMTVHVEPHASAQQLVMFGAGHVGRATAALAKGCGFRVTVVDERPEWANRDEHPTADELLCCPLGEAFGRLKLDGDSCVIIATPGHVQDFDAVRGALGSGAGFIGLLGSRRKRETLLALLEQEGFSPEQRARVTTPVGLEIGAQTPQEIAVSIVGQLIRRRRGA